MYFYKVGGKPQLDASGNLILSKNDALAAHSCAPAGPRKMLKANYVLLKGRGFFGKVGASITALNWIWSK